MKYEQFTALLNNINIKLFDSQERVVYHRLTNYINQGYDISNMSLDNFKLLTYALLDNYDTRIKYILSLK